ncbi:MAG: hypothetical protein ACYCZV_15460 [Acidimicrobiales bacterium]
MSRLLSAAKAATGHKGLVFATVAVLAITSAGGSAYALTTSATSPPATASHASTAKHYGHHATLAALSRVARLVEHATHVQAVVPSKGSFVTFTLDRGVVSSVSTSDISVTEAGQTRPVQDAIVSSTHVLPAVLGGITAVKVGDHVVVVAKNGTATLIWLPGARPHIVRGVVTSLPTTSSDTLVISMAKGKKSLDLIVGPKTRVLPTSVGGVSGIHDGMHVAIHDVAGNATVIRVLGSHAGKGSVPAS